MTAALRLALTAAILCGAASAKTLDAAPRQTLVLAQLSMKNPNAHIGAQADTLTPDEQKRLAARINQLTPKQRKQLAKAMKKMTPAQQNQFAASLKRQLHAEAAKK